MRLDPNPHRDWLDFALLLASVSAGLAIAWIDARPHWDDDGVTAAFLLMAGGLLGLLGPRRPWLWGLAIGLWIPIRLILGKPTLGSIAGGLVILAIPLAGAYAGMAVRRLLAAA